ncbi:hypothetical protein DB30_02048 [Enhygromyxa salina]|uniref:Uncharacterized protein n=1 Tax=Enhygromyxa salina TaxID=215803 RepID=A0A0C1ZMC1_9BACT|nr:hypothetical protein [Enhygromyxa salina]KIG12103.1 hypothetical protein DB30_02048 [Enhygromyxa salina]
MGLFDRFRGSKPAPPPKPNLVANAAMLGNDMVLAAMIAPAGHPIESVIAQAARGEFTPVIADASLYWTLCAVRASDQFQTARLAELLRYARITPIERATSDQHGWTPPSSDETEHWRSVVFNDTNNTYELPAPTPELMCSRCYTLCSGANAHVIPWWNEHAGDVFTTYRCEACWLESLDDTQRLVESAQFDDDVCDKFVAFFQRHEKTDVAARLAELPRAAVREALIEVLAQVRARALVLHP